MATGQAKPSFQNDPAVRVYTLICLAALLFILIGQAEQGIDPLALLTVFAGLAGLALHSNLATLMVLLALAGRIFLYQQANLGPYFWGPRSGIRTGDIILACAVLGFAMAHYRLLGLVKNIFPSDLRRRQQNAGSVSQPAPGIGQRRSARLAGPAEWAFLLLILPIFGLLARVAWLLLPGPRFALNLAPWFWDVALPFWLLALVLIVASSLLGYWKLRNMTAVEGQVLLQDILWQETRREQRWINRWLAWDRWRRQQREDKS